MDTIIANTVDAEVDAGAIRFLYGCHFQLDTGAGVSSLDRSKDKSTTPGSSSVVHKSRSKELAATLLKSMSINRGGSYNRQRWLSENKKMVQTAESISRTLGVVVRSLLQIIKKAD